MNKLKEIFLLQGGRKFNLGRAGSAGLDISKTITLCKNVRNSPSWEVIIESPDVEKIYDAWQTNHMFTLHAEWTARERDQKLLESVYGEIEIVEIMTNKNCKGWFIKGLAPKLHFSSSRYAAKEKVQFT